MRNPVSPKARLSMGDAAAGRDPGETPPYRPRRRLIGPIGRNIAPRGPIADCVEDTEYPESARRLADPPPVGHRRMCAARWNFNTTDRNPAKSPLN